MRSCFIMSWINLRYIGGRSGIVFYLMIRTDLATIFKDLGIVQECQQSMVVL